MTTGRSKQDAAGELKARFDLLVREHFDRIYNLALMRCNRPDLAEDMTQETFIRAYKGLRAFRGDAQVSTWLYRIAINVCHSMMKKESRYVLPDENLQEDRNTVFQPDPAPSAETEYFKQQQKIQLRLAIQQLPRAQADALTLYYLREYDYREVAEIMKLPMGTVKSHLHRAKNNLKRILSEVNV